MKSLRIIPPKPCNGVTRAQGTRVMVGDEELRVSGITLTARVGDLWRATLETNGVEMPEGMTATVHAPEYGSSPFIDALTIDHAPHVSPGVAFLQSLQWTPHEMARFQDRARGVHRRLAHWYTTPPGKRYREPDPFADLRRAWIRKFAP
jgi:hypothetical protein